MGVLLELRGDVHIFCALKHLRINDIGNDRLIFAGKVFVQQISQLIARDVLPSHGCPP